MRISQRGDYFIIQTNIKNEKTLKFATPYELASDDFKLDGYLVGSSTAYPSENSAAKALAEYFGANLPFHPLLVQYRESKKAEQPAPPAQG